MHHPNPPAGIRGPFRLISPLASGSANGNPGDLAERAQEHADTRKRVLVVEDEFLLAAVLASDLQQAGYEVLGPFVTLTEAMEAAGSESFDGAILDINLKGELVYPLADELTRQGIPFLFLSGYEARNIPESFRGHARLAKPADPAAILRAVRSMLRTAS